MPERILPYRNKIARQPDQKRAKPGSAGFRDPDAHDPQLRRDAPTLSRVGFLLQATMYRRLLACAGDATAAFLQGSPTYFQQERKTGGTT
eukprot:230217-Amphidinium_carterae.1